MKERIHYVDIAKAFAILLIALGHTLVHSKHCGLIYKFLYSFHVVLFFILSGYTFRVDETQKFIGFFAKKFLRIMVPYFVWAMLFLIPYLLFGGSVNRELGTSGVFEIRQLLLDTLYGNGCGSALKQNTSLWFLPALFMMEIIYYFIVRRIQKGRWYISIVVLAVVVCISYLAKNYLSWQLPWGINTALTAGVFFYLGYLYKRYGLLEKGSYIMRLYVIIPAFVGGSRPVLQTRKCHGGIISMGF